MILIVSPCSVWAITRRRPLVEHPVEQGDLAIHVVGGTPERRVSPGLPAAGSLQGLHHRARRRGWRGGCGALPWSRRPAPQTSGGARISLGGYPAKRLTSFTRSRRRWFTRWRKFQLTSISWRAAPAVAHGARPGRSGKRGVSHS